MPYLYPEVSSLQRKPLAGSFCDRTMKSRRIAFGLIVATLAGLTSSSTYSADAGARAASADMHRIVCPLYLPADAIKKGQHLPENWTVSTEAWRLDGGGLLHGSPDEEGILRPDVATAKKHGTREVSYRRWELSVPHPHETWLFCGYGPVKLARRIPVDATVCTSDGGAEKGIRVATVFQCK